ncbi:MAG TPA: YDG domain-containing protein [Terriglobia bacterium]|nr:YDG domain-containing protein [Terriglobia bacterium]
MQRAIKRIFSFLGSIAILCGGFVILHGSLPPVSINAWLPAGNLTAARAGAGSVLLQDGRLLITGGNGASGALATTEILDPSRGFTPGPPMNFARSNHVAMLLRDGRVLVAGGTDASGRASQSAELFDPAANSWSAAGPLMVGRSGATATLLPSGHVLIAGGTANGAALASFELFDPNSNTFSLAAGTLSSPRENHAAALLPDGRVLIAGGWDGTTQQSQSGPGGPNVLASTDIFDPSTGAGAPGPALTGPRMNFTATTALDGSVVAIGGTNGQNDLASIDVLAPGAGAFALSGTNLATARQGHLAFLLPHNGNILVVGGTSSGAAVSSTELYTPWTGATSVTGALASARSGATGSSLFQTVLTAPVGIDGALLVAGGQDPSSPPSTLQSAEVYGFATIKTDKADYAPGETANITGSGWRPGEVVQMSLVEVPDLDADSPIPLTATADASGNLPTIAFPIDIADLNVHFTLTAVDSVSQAQTRFTDANPQSVTVGTQSPNPVPAGNSATYTVTVAFNGNSTTSCTADLSVSGLPSGASLQSFSPASLTSTGTDQTSTLIINTTGSTGTGSHSFSVTATPESGSCQNPNARSGNGTLAVSAPVNVSTTTTVTSSANPSAYGDSLSFTATIVPASGSTAPTGTVQFAIDSVNFGSPVSLGACAPSPHACATSGSTSTLTVSGSPHTVTATYAATGSFTGSSGPLSGGQTVNKKTLTASMIGDPTKPYDGNANATLTSANFLLSGLVGSDSFTVTTTTGTYNSASVAGANTVTTSLAAGDFTANGSTVAGNYTLPTTASGPGHITAVTLTASIIGNPTKPYDANTNATLSSTNFSLSGLVGGDSFTVTKTTGSYDTKDVATANTVTTSLAGTDFTAGGSTLATNYVLPTTASGPGHITAVTLTSSIIGDPTRPYDGTTTATLAPANFSLSGLVGSESFTVTQTVGTYNSKDVVSATTVTASLTAGNFTPVGSALASNYALPTTASGAGHITAATLTASIVNNPTKPYDGNTNATLTSTNFSLSGLASGESITVTKTTGTYNSKDVATATTVNTSLAPGDFTVGAGTDLSNYVLPTSASGPGHITAVTLTASIIGDPTKPYDGYTPATLTSANFSLSGLVGSDSFTVTKTSGTYNTKDVLTANTVTASLAGTDFTPGGSTLASNYNLPTTASGPGHITPRDLTVTATGVNKVYDGGTSATLNLSDDRLSGDEFTDSYTSASFADKNVGTGKPVSVTGISISGTDAGNYRLHSTTASTTANITPASLTITAQTNTKAYDGNTSAAAVPIVTGLQGTDTVTGLVEAYTDPLPGSGKTLTVTAYTVNDGNGGNNYTVTTVDNHTGVITYGICSAGYGPGGVILPPIKSDGTSVYNRKGGSTIPVKFTVCDASGMPISNPAAVFAGTGGSLTYLSAVRGTIDNTTVDGSTDVPDVAFRFTGGQWIFNMATSNLPASSTDTFVINLAYGKIAFVIGVK